MPDPRDVRDLEVLAARASGANVIQIAKATRLKPDVVATILAADADEFPDESLRRQA